MLQQQQHSHHGQQTQQTRAARTWNSLTASRGTGRAVSTILHGPTRRSEAWLWDELWQAPKRRIQEESSSWAQRAKHNTTQRNNMMWPCCCWKQASTTADHLWWHYYNKATDETQKRSGTATWPSSVASAKIPQIDDARSLTQPCPDEWIHIPFWHNMFTKAGWSWCENVHAFPGVVRVTTFHIPTRPGLDVCWFPMFLLYDCC